MNELEDSIETILKTGMYPRLFSEKLQIIPNIKEVYELALAFYESQILSDDELLRNGAYFSRIEGSATNHYLMCAGDPVKVPDYASSRLKSFFEKGIFRTGYATHGLFPYRGKFHPQMVKALLNIMGLKPGQTVLDPMMGSGTLLVEASLMGINSIGSDPSPFCSFMTKVKLNALTLDLAPLQQAIENFRNLYEYFSELIGASITGKKQKFKTSIKKNATIKEKLRSLDSDQIRAFLDSVGSGKGEIYDFLLLAYLDSVGYSERSSRKAPIEQFRNILERYIFVTAKIQKTIKEKNIPLANAKSIRGDSRNIPLVDDSVDGILFSPPYSFAIDYLKNDDFHLKAMGCDASDLKKCMIGLRGKGLREKYELYVQDMESTMSECSRVLRCGRYCTVIIGTNDSQLSKALGVPKNKVVGLHKMLIGLASNYNLLPVRVLPRQISGMANTMRVEYIVIFRLV